MTIRRQSPWVYPFLAAAIIHAWLLVLDPRPFNARFIAILISLLGAVLFVRRADAARTTPLVAFGLGLLAFGALLPVIDLPVIDALDSLVPPTDAFGGVSPGLVAVDTFQRLVVIAGTLYLGTGLAAIRRTPNTGATRAIAVWAVAIGLATVAIGTLAIGIPSTAGQWTLVAISLATSLLATLAWCYVLAVVVGGWLGRETPVRGWALASIATALGLAERFVAAAISLLAPVSGQIAAAGWLGTTVIVSWILWLAAIAAGLPGMVEAAEDGAASTTVDPSVATPPGSATG